MVELTEDSLVNDPETAARVLAGCVSSASGSPSTTSAPATRSLSYLRRLPVDEVKLDRSFTVGVGVDPAAEAVIAHTVGLVHALGLHLVAEGVEDRFTAERLADLGCDSGQGYLWAHPEPVERFLAGRLAQEAVARSGDAGLPVTAA